MTTLADLLVAQARRTPDVVAVEQWDRHLTYGELLDRASRLAGVLRAGGVGPETRVGICVRRTLDLPVAVLGVLLSGGAYVPLDPDHPIHRLTTILDDAGIGQVVADPPGRALLAGTGRALVDPAGAHPAAPSGPTGCRPDHAAYVLYTSGSTGRPKGVVVSHRNAVAFGDAVRRLRPTGPGCRSAGFASLAFDTSLFDLIHPLATGATVALLPAADRVDPVRLQRFLAAHRVTRAMLPPAVLPLLDPDGLPELTELFAAGEPCGPEQVARWAVPGGRRFHNWYGPTETTVIVTGTELTGKWSEPLSIGRALPGCRAYVLDQRTRPVPPGEPGELCIGGPQVARGYLGRPGHTADRFVPDPFGDTPGARLYRTGDLVAVRPSGELSYLGRLDRQVKIHGQRVEIGELEAVLSGHPRVRQVAVDVTGDGGLVAYLSPADGPDPAEIREYCARYLPAYVVPGRVVRLTALPLNVSGKVDLAALRESVPTTPVRAADGEPDTVATIWADVFGGPVPAPDTDFAGAGGHSLLAMRLVSALRARLHRQVDVTDVHLGRTVAGLAERVRLAPPITDDTLATGSPAALSGLQRRLWFVEQLCSGVTAHNIAMAERIDGPLDEAALRTALRMVAARQAALRWRIVAEHGVPKVAVDPEGDVPLPVVDLTGHPETEVRRLLDDAATTPFDLAAGPLWRALLIRVAARTHVLAITVHHVVFDGWSADVLYRDLGVAYRDALAGRSWSGVPLRAGFADYVAWSAARAAGAARTALDWWSDHLADAPLVVDLPRDRPRPAVQTFRGASADGRIGREVADRVRSLGRAGQATPFVVLLAVFGQLLGRLTGQPELIVGTPLVDRAHAAFEPVVGCCLHVLPLRLSGAGEFTEVVRVARDELAAVRAHADVPLEQLVGALPGQRDLSRNPLVQVLFNLYNFAAARMDLPDATTTPLDPGLPGSLYDLTLYVGERDGGFDVRAVYNPDLFDADRIDALLADYVSLVDQLTGAPADLARLRHPLPPADPPATVDTPDLLARFATRAAAHPGRIAVRGVGGTLTYAELAGLAERVAGAVRQAGIRAGDVVAIAAGRDVALPAVLFGVLATGARWLLVDPAYPSAVLAGQVAEADPRAVIRLPGIPAIGELPAIEVDLSPGAGPVGEPVATDRGYLSLTSGSTGRPRPVVTTDRPLAHFLDWYPKAFGLTEDDRFALLAGLAHDPLLRDMCVPLVLGGTLAVPDADLIREPRSLAAWLAGERITVLHLTPQLGRLVAATGAVLERVRLVLLGGDQSTGTDVAALRRLAPAARLVNGYGTTETPQVQAMHEMTGPDPAQPGGEPLPVGLGAGGARLVVLAGHGRPAGVGELGEVLICGPHLATGYLDPAATADRFGDGGPVAGRWFRTGDLGRHRPDGSVVLAGRVDGQVKVRGFRVELGAVRAALADHPDVREAWVLAVADGVERRLRGYVVPARAGLRTWQVVDHLRGRLPDYAVPADLVLLPQLPLTRNGKVDQEALLRLVPAGPGGSAEELTGRTQRVIAGVWSEVLGLPRLAATDNFFEIGGHSLALVVVRDRLAGLLGRDIPVVDLFRHPTIRALAAHLDGSGRDSQVDRALARAAWRRDRARGRRAHQPSREQGVGR
ncbi:MAG TPA: amino acid adenylation domain-containing protein [Pseudonocardiaceae bacterium]|nr:amino acid adenylation domain-containing protein [Pseudonocardiaceae bacterium]